MDASNPPRRRKISAIIACYKDAQAIPIMAERLTQTFRKIEVDYEIIFVNDGSPDDTQPVLEQLAAADPHIKGITHSRNFGSQSAFTSGMKLATGGACVLLDGDLQDPPELIESFYEKWCEGYEVVYGIRIKREMPTVTEFGYKAFYRLFQSLAYVRVPLDAGDFSLIDRSVVQVLNKLPERDRFLRGLPLISGDDLHLRSGPSRRDLHADGDSRPRQATPLQRPAARGDAHGAGASLRPAGAALGR